MEDARAILQIANKRNFRAAIHQRLRKLEQSGISGSKFTVNNKVLGYNDGFCWVYLDKAARNPRSC
jgi:hypothetical protein